MHHGSPIQRTRQLGGLGEEVVVDVDGRSHDRSKASIVASVDDHLEAWKSGIQMLDFRKKHCQESQG
jgi:hypothetical protein